MASDSPAPEGATDPWATVQAFDLHGYGGYPFRQEDRPDGLYVLRTDVDRARAAVETAHRQEIERLRAEIAELHDIVTAFDAITNPEEFPDLHERAFQALSEEGADHTICRALQQAEGEVERLTQERDAVVRLNEHDTARIVQLEAEIARLTTRNEELETAAMTDDYTRRLERRVGVLERQVLEGGEERERLSDEVDALAAQVATLREALQQIVDYDELLVSEYRARYGEGYGERSEADIARAALAATEGGTK